MSHQTKRRGTLWGSLALLLAAGVALAGIDMEAQSELTSTPTTVTIDTGSPDTKATSTAVRAIETKGNPTCYVAPLSATTIGATATLRVELYRGDDWIGTAYIGTVTFSTTATSGAYLSDDPIVATSCRSATKVDVKVLNVSAGSVSLKRWVGSSEAGQ